MDPVTHGLVGATFSQSLADKSKYRLASVIGFGSALLADADVFISSSSDPLLNLEIHRQFTHSLFFIPFGALVVTILAWWFVKKRISFKETYLFSLAGYFTAGLMDFFTSYGVHLLWPFTDSRYALDIISVFDPLFTVGVLVFTGLAFYKSQKTYTLLTLSWILIYLAFGYSQQNRALKTLEQTTLQTGHQLNQVVIKPTIANQWLWSARNINDGTVYSYGIRIVPFTEPTVYEGETA